jgi:hypothetical protein
MDHDQVINKLKSYFSEKGYKVIYEDFYNLTFQSNKRELNPLLIIFFCICLLGLIGLALFIIYYFAFAKKHTVEVRLTVTGGQARITATGVTKESRQYAEEIMAMINGTQSPQNA